MKTYAPLCLVAAALVGCSPAAEEPDPEEEELPPALDAARPDTRPRATDAGPPADAAPQADAAPRDGSGTAPDTGSSQPCRPTGGGPYWVEEGTPVKFTVSCAT